MTVREVLFGKDLISWAACAKALPVASPEVRDITELLFSLSFPKNGDEYTFSPLLNGEWEEEDVCKERFNKGWK